jgi:hypothetical protein
MVDVGGISVWVGSTSVGCSVGGRDKSIGVLSGVALERHPLTKISVINTMIENPGFMRCLSILLEIFSIFLFSRIVLDYGYWVMDNWVNLAIIKSFFAVELSKQDIFFLDC